MDVIRISPENDVLILYFESERKRINAYTLASVLVSIADAAKAANEVINPGYDVEVVVDAIAPGSFKAAIRTIYSKAKNLFDRQDVKAIALSLVASFIYEKGCASSPTMNITVNTNETIIECGNDRVIIPREVHEASQAAAKNPAFVSAVSRTAETITEDEQISGFGFASNINAAKPDVAIDREKLKAIASLNSDPEPDTRIVEEQCSLTIIKAILERSRRKWEFVWRGVRITAPVLDSAFYERFVAHTITIAPGDELKVRLAMKQSKDIRTGVYTNDSYEVTEVLEHVPATQSH